MEPVIEIIGLRIEIEGADPGTEPIVQNIDISVAPGEVVALIGESGSGKTTIALSSLGYVRPGLNVTAGTVLLKGEDIFALKSNALRNIRGNRVAYVAQSASAAFNPGLKIGEQVIEPLLEHRLTTKKEGEERARAFYRDLRLPNPDSVGERFPHEVSGGQLQRLMAAMAMCSGPELIVFDEPTTALDVTTQMSVLQAFKRLIRERGAAAIYVSHDLALVAQIADRVFVLLDGKIQEQGSVKKIIEAPRMSYTRTLMAASDPELAIQARRPANASPTAIDLTAQKDPILRIEGIVAGYGALDRQGMPAIPIIHDIDLTIRPGEIIGVIGESGSGKSTVARVIAGLLPAAKGAIHLGDRTLASRIENRSRDDLRRIQIIFQSADTSLNPSHTIGKILGRPIEYFQDLRGSDKKAKIAETLELVGLPAAFADRKPAELSGGQKQRVNLARALACDPDVVLCDEVTSSLDSVVRIQIIELLQDLKERLGLALMFISHDISTIASLAEVTAVMHRGRIVEKGPTQDILHNPQHPYTKLLVGSVPHLRVGWLEEALSARSDILAEASGITLQD